MSGSKLDLGCPIGMNATAAAAVLLVVRLAVMEAAAEDVFCAANLSVFFVN